MNANIPTSERLVQAAIPLIWRHGYSAVSVDTICRAAGAHKGSFYHAFPSKAALLARAIDMMWEWNGATLRALAAQGGTPAERLDRHLDWFLESQRDLLEAHGFVPGHFHMAVETNVPEAAARSAKHRAEAKALLSQLLEAALKDRQAAPDTIGWLTDTIDYIVSGLMIEARFRNSLEPLLALKPTVLRLLEHVVPGERTLS